MVDKTRQLVGIVSEHDLLSSLDGGRAWKAQTAEALMSANPLFGAAGNHVGDIGACIDGE